MTARLIRLQRRRGTPLWAHLVALVLVPLLGVGGLVGLTVSRASADAADAERAEGAVRAAGVLANAAGAVDQEVLPVLTVAALQSPEMAADLGIPALFAQAAVGAAREGLAGARRVTDAALAEALAQPTGADAARVAAGTLADLRRQADDPTIDLEQLTTVYDGLGQVADGLVAAQRDAVAVASASDVSPATTAAVRDADVVARLVQAGSRQLPQFLGWTFSSAAGLATGDDWPGTRDAWTAAVARMGDLADPGLLAAWEDLRTSPAAEALAAAVDGTEGVPAVPSMAAITALIADSVERGAAAGDLLSVAVDRAVASAVDDRRAADLEQAVTVALGALVALVAVAVAWWVARAVARSLASVAGQAERISHGSLVEVPVAGPREVRTISGALGDAVASLRRIQDQAAAVARGELDSPTLSDALPGPLGEVVHASVQQLVSSLQQRDRLQSELAHQAAHDPLTDLPNRAQALRLTDAALARAQRSGSMVGVLFVDLDGFKSVNDRAGHAAGDAMLRAVADRLSAGVRTGDTVCRLGGDEFVALIEPLEDQTALVALAERLVAAVAEDVLVTTASGSVVPVHVGASIGVAFAQDGGLDGDALIAQADAAAYLAKARGKGRVEIFDDVLRAQMSARRELEAGLRTALDEDQLHVAYQPVVDLDSGRLTGYEALVRWDRPGHGLMAPADFVAVAEQSDLVCDLDRWVLHEACRQLASWRAGTGAEPGEAGPTMAVNLSGRHLADPRVVGDVLDALTASGLPARLLVLEVTETVLVDAPAALEHLAQLRASGVEVAIDDFGTGYTSIGQLGLLPVTTLKIDRSFVASADPSARSLLSLMIQTAHTIGLTVVAEGVEVPGHLTQLRSDDCDRAQGYLMARPMPAGDAGALYRSDRPLLPVWPSAEEPAMVTTPAGTGA